MADDSVLGTYSPEEIQVVISVADRVHVVSGFADGTFINISRITPASELYVGADLSAGRTKRRNKASTIDITLAQYSASNDVFQRIQSLDEADPTDSYVFALTIKDNSGRTVASSNQAFVATTPDVSFDTTMGTRNWQISAVSLTPHYGGNAKLSDETVSTLAALDYEVPARWRING